MADIVVFIRGGVFQGAISNSRNNRIMVVDYDDEAAAERTTRRPLDLVEFDPDVFLEVTTYQTTAEL